VKGVWKKGKFVLRKCKKSVNCRKNPEINAKKMW
jgi:hypothetical protein